MDLTNAIKRAVRFCPKGKETPEVLKQIHGTDGIVGTVIQTDHLPDMILSAENALAISKKKVQSIYIEEMPLTDGSVGLSTIFRMQDGGCYQLPHKNDECFPQVPPFPAEWVPVDDMDWAWVMKVIHASNPLGNLISGKERQDLECIHFKEDRVEATDTARVALAEVYVGIIGKVPARVFKSFPSGPVFTGCSEGFVWFRIGDEFRYARIQEGKYASDRNLREYVPEYHNGPWVAVSVVEMRAAIAHALAVAPTRSVFMEFGLGVVRVKSGSEDASFENEVPVTVPGIPGFPMGAKSEYPKIIIDGKFLLEALKGVTTPRVRLGYHDRCEQLRLESGAYVEALWNKTA